MDIIEHTSRADRRAFWAAYLEAIAMRSLEARSDHSLPLFLRLQAGA
jgi:hypothetical protein